MLPPCLLQRLTLPVFVAPMFLVSGPQLVIQSCKQGLVGSFPSLNTRTMTELDHWLTEINQALTPKCAPYAVNLIVHKTNTKLKDHLELMVKHRVPIVITSLGAVQSVIDAIHSYKGLVFHDVTNLYHAKKAVQAGVDGLIAVCAGAGGHAGLTSPLALIPQLRTAFPKLPLLVAGAISEGRTIRAMQVLGADAVYMGTRFIATQESMAQHSYKTMLVQSKQGPSPNLLPIIYTNRISGVYANFLRESLTQAGLNPDTLASSDPVEEDFSKLDSDAKAWKDIWSAGHGVLNIHDIPTVAELVNRLRSEYSQSINEEIHALDFWKNKAKL